MKHMTTGLGFVQREQKYPTDKDGKTWDMLQDIQD